MVSTRRPGPNILPQISRVSRKNLCFFFFFSYHSLPRIGRGPEPESVPYGTNYVPVSFFIDIYISDSNSIFSLKVAILGPPWAGIGPGPFTSLNKPKRPDPQLTFRIQIQDCAKTH